MFLGKLGVSSIKESLFYDTLINKALDISREWYFILIFACLFLIKLCSKWATSGSGPYTIIGELPLGSRWQGCGMLEN